MNQKRIYVFLLVCGLIISIACNLGDALRPEPIQEIKTFLPSLTAIIDEAQQIITQIPVEEALGTAEALATEMPIEELGEDILEFAGEAAQENLDLFNDYFNNGAFAPSRNWCSPRGYLIQAGIDQLKYFEMTSNGPEDVEYNRFNQMERMQAVVVGAPGEYANQNMPIVYFDPATERIMQWKYEGDPLVLREEIEHTTLVSAPASEYFLFSNLHIEADGSLKSSIYLATKELARITPPIAERRDTNGRYFLKPISIQTSANHAVEGVFITQAVFGDAHVHMVGPNNGLTFLSLTEGESRKVIDDQWQILGVSRSGKYAAVNAANGDQSLVLVNLETGQQTLIPAKNGYQLRGAGYTVFRPDDFQFAWVEGHEDGTQYQIWVADFNGKQISQLPPRALNNAVGGEIYFVQPLGWLNDNFLAMYVDHGEQSMVVMDIEKQAVAWVTHGHFLDFVYDPAACP